MTTMTTINNTQVPPYVVNEIKPMSFIFEINTALTQNICMNIIERFEANPAQRCLS